MTPEQWDRVRDLLMAVRDKQERERGEFLSRMCDDDEVLAKVESILADDEEAEWFLERGRPDDTVAGQEKHPTGPTIASQASSDIPGVTEQPSPQMHDRIGPYRILDVIGKGGMGIVYRAEQDSPRRTVALKVIRPGAESPEMLKRFEHEAQVLGRLYHSGIARIYEAGTAETAYGSEPYFAMELIQGRRLLEFARERNLSVDGRLELLAKICDAVHHAHQKGVIHRDLKPGNVLVDEHGQPKILDFGVARITNADIRTTTVKTRVGELIGTVAYMSPEQVLGDPGELDTRSDVYALGVLGYELLTGRLPLDVMDKPIHTAVKTIIDEDPEPLRSVDRLLRGDIETIIGKALEKEKNRRYQSASDMAADIRRYLTHLPITARPTTTLYQLRKFARRNRPLVAGIVVAFLALVIGIIGTTSQAIRATRERDNARRAESLAEQRLQQVQAEAAKVEAINRFFNEMLASADPTKDGREVRVVDVLSRAAENVSSDLSQQPEIEASLQSTIGMVYTGLGLYEEAEPHLRSALETTTGLLGEKDEETLARSTNLASALKEMGRWDEAEQLVRQTLDVRREKLGPENERTVESMNNLADVMQKQGKVAEAEKLWREALRVQRRILEPDDPDLLITMNNLAQLLKQLRRPADAEPLLREALELQTKTQGEEHPHTLATMSNLATTLKAEGKLREAEGILRQVVTIRRRTLGDHPTLFSSVSNLANLLREQGRLDEAETLAREAAEGYRRSGAGNTPKGLVTGNNLASLWVEMGRSTQAETLYVSLLQAAERTLPPGHYMTLIFQRNYGQCLTALGRFEEAEELLLESYDGLEASLGREHQHTHKTLQYITELYDTWGKGEEAQRWRAKAATQSDE
jgi:serine/threonine protein kinase